VTTLLVERIEHPDAAESSGGPTLEHLIAGVWHDLAHRATAVCPVCAGEMSPSFAAHGTCTACGTELS
jgi:DnaJ-class molecular chaperone